MRERRLAETQVGGILSDREGEGAHAGSAASVASAGSPAPVEAPHGGMDLGRTSRLRMPEQVHAQPKRLVATSACDTQALKMQRRTNRSGPPSARPRRTSRLPELGRETARHRSPSRGDEPDLHRLRELARALPLRQAPPPRPVASRRGVRVTPKRVERHCWATEPGIRQRGRQRVAGAGAAPRIRPARPNADGRRTAGAMPWRRDAASGYSRRSMPAFGSHSRAVDTS